MSYTFTSVKVFRAVCQNWNRILSESAIKNFSGGIENVELDEKTSVKNQEYLFGWRTRSVQTCPILEHKYMQDSDYIQIAKACPNLEIFTIWSYCGGHLSDNSVFEIVTRCPRLSNFTVSGDQKITNTTCFNISDNCKNLSSLSLNLHKTRVNDVGFIYLLNGCLEMKELNIGFTRGNLEEESFCEISKLKNLESLMIDFNISDNTLIQIANGCRKLKNLDVISDIITRNSVLEVSKLCTEIVEIKLSSTVDIFFWIYLQMRTQIFKNVTLQFKQMMIHFTIF